MMRRGRLRLLVAATAIALVAVPLGATVAFAQTPMDDPLDARDAKRVDRMEKVVRELRDIVFKAQKTGGPVVVQPADTDARLADLATRIADVEGSLTKLNGSLETTTHDLDQARRENTALRAQVKALSDRLTADEQKAAEAAVAATAAAGPPPPPEAPAQAADSKVGAADAFAKARQLMLGGDYEAAQTAFSDYVTTYPETPRAPEARYWWGKTLIVRGDYVRSASAFIGAIRGWPQTAWAPDAVVELARSLVQLKKPADACETLTELRRRYPKAPPAITGRAATVRLEAKCA